jgi:hypothetical protein
MVTVRDQLAKRVECRPVTGVTAERVFQFLIF